MLNNLIDIDSLTTSQIIDLINTAKSYLQNSQNIPNLKNKILANLFVENSTRTRISFEIAAKKLGMHVINIDANKSSLQKGESIHDTIQTLTSLDVDVVVLRQSQEKLPEILAKKNPNIAIINAGDGMNAHPSQALLDMLTINLHKYNFNNLKVAIIGDCKHSRVAKSNISILKKLGVKDIRLISPEKWQLNNSNVNCFNDLNKGLIDVDVIITLRVQKERLNQDEFINESEYLQKFTLKQENLIHAKSDVIILHPGPVNRNVEICNSLVEKTLMLEQVNNGLFMRMAIIAIMQNNLKNLH